MRFFTKDRSLRSSESVGPISKDESSRYLKEVERRSGTALKWVAALRDSRLSSAYGRRGASTLMTRIEYVGKLMYAIRDSFSPSEKLLESGVSSDKSTVEEVNGFRREIVEGDIAECLKAFRSGEIQLYKSSLGEEKNRSLEEFAKYLLIINGFDAHPESSIEEGVLGRSLYNYAKPIRYVRKLEHLPRIFQELADSPFGVIGLDDVGTSVEEMNSFAKTLCVKYGKQLLGQGEYEKLAQHVRESEMTFEDVGTTKGFVNDAITEQKQEQERVENENVIRIARVNAKQAIQTLLAQKGEIPQEVRELSAELVEKL